MAVRIRENGQIVCAALRPEMPGDVYLDDAIHYRLSAIDRVLVTEPMEQHKIHAEWWWRDAVPAHIEIADFYR